MMSCKKLMLLYFLWTWHHAKAGKAMTITSNVSEVSIGDSYSVTCTSIYPRVDFYRNNTNIARPRLEYFGAPCMVNNTVSFNCTITYHKNIFEHQLIIFSAKQTGTTQWQCNPATFNRVFSNIIFITITDKGNGYKPLETTLPTTTDNDVSDTITDSATSLPGPQVTSPTNIKIIALLGLKYTKNNQRPVKIDKFQVKVIVMI
ncbi:hypothetical protein SNE40_015926 [Patella caerulea]|uniref:Uncharacterized protein n=1 Tax=Patella caerulea TaxID=87958 RepID=A0AAN8PC80_PATCE